MTNRFQTFEQTLSWFSPCVLFCAAPFLVIIAVYTIVRVVRGRQGRGAANMYDPQTSAKIERVETGEIRFTRAEKSKDP